MVLPSLQLLCAVTKYRVDLRANATLLNTLVLLYTLLLFKCHFGVDGKRHGDKGAALKTKAY